MPDHPFHFTDTAQGYPARVERQAVIGYVSSRGEDVRYTCCRRSEGVVGTWRTRVDRLKVAGCHSVAGPKAQWARNCPPTGVVRDEKRKLRFCNLSRVCPWCFARAHAVGTYKLLERALFPGNTLLSGFKLLIRSETLVVERDRNFAYAIYYGRGFVDTIQGVKLATASGFTSLLAVYPRKDRWCVSARMLAVVPEDWEDLGPKWKTSRSIRFKRQLVPYAARFGFYPKGLLTGDEHMLANYLDADVPVKLRKSFGILTQRSSSGRASKLKEEGDGTGSD
jgi:hypothetical protein